MNITVYSATGCTRCKIVKGFMSENNIPYVDYDMKAEGKDEFQSFYKANRPAVYRGPDGIEFPIVTDGQKISQGIAVAIAFLQSGDKLDGFFKVGIRHKEWVDGILISEGNPEFGEDFLSVLRYLKARNMKLEIVTDGRNSGLLERVLNEGLADLVIMHLPSDIAAFNSDDVRKTIALVPCFEDYKFIAAIVPVTGADGEVRYLTPEEIAESARVISEVTGSQKNKFYIQPCQSGGQKPPLEALPDAQLFKYRSKARAYQVFAEIDSTK